MSKEVYIVENIPTENRIKLNGIEKTYKPYELSKVVEAEDNIIIPNTQTANNKLIRLFKQLDISQNNLINGKRNR